VNEGLVLLAGWAQWLLVVVALTWSVVRNVRRPRADVHWTRPPSTRPTDTGAEHHA
jgi:hypothetical protein